MKIHIHATLNEDIAKWLKTYSTESGIPQTVIIEKALKAYKEKIK